MILKLMLFLLVVCPLIWNVVESVYFFEMDNIDRLSLSLLAMTTLMILADAKGGKDV
jgi:hypothetical protein